jgi:hypothetical protein
MRLPRSSNATCGAARASGGWQGSPTLPSQPTFTWIAGGLHRLQPVQTVRKLGLRRFLQKSRRLPSGILGRRGRQLAQFGHHGVGISSAEHR